MKKRIFGSSLAVVLVISAICTLAYILIPSDIKVEFEIVDAKSTYKYGDKITMQATIRNTGLQPKKFTFSSGCTEGSLFVDDEEVGGVVGACTAAVTDTVIGPFQTLTYGDIYTLSASESPSSFDDNQLKIAEGAHTLTYKWKDIISNPVSITVTK